MWYCLGYLPANGVSPAEVLVRALVAALVDATEATLCPTLLLLPDQRAGAPVPVILASSCHLHSGGSYCYVGLLLLFTNEKKIIFTLNIRVHLMCTHYNYNTVNTFYTEIKLQMLKVWTYVCDYMSNNKTSLYNYVNVRVR